MLEQKIEELNGNIVKLIAVLTNTKITTSGGSAPAGDEKKGRGRPAGSKNKTEEQEEDSGLDGLDGEDSDLGLGDEEPELTQEDVVAAFKALKAAKGVDACKAVLKAIGESNALNIPAEKFAKAKAEIDKAAKKK